MLPVQQQNASEHLQNVGATRLNFVCLKKYFSSLAALVAMKVEARQVKLQINRFRREH
jgi:hypothetical protein